MCLSLNTVSTCLTTEAKRLLWLALMSFLDNVYGANGEHKSAVCQTHNPREILKGIHFQQSYQWISAFIKVVSLYLPLSNISLQQSSCDTKHPLLSVYTWRFNWFELKVIWSFFQGLLRVLLFWLYLEPAFCLNVASPIHLYSWGSWQRGRQWANRTDLLNPGPAMWPLLCSRGFRSSLSSLSTRRKTWVNSACPVLAPVNPGKQV